MITDEINDDEINLIQTEETDAEEEQRRLRRRARIAQMRREKERQLRRQRIFVIALPAAAVLLIIGVIFAAVRAKGDDGKAEDMPPSAMSLPEEGAGSGASASADSALSPDFVPPSDSEAAAGTVAEEEPAPEPVHYSAQLTPDTKAPPEEVNSTNAVFIELDTGNILAQRDCKAVVNPASMTKVLTVLVAAEHVEDLDNTFTITIDITDYSFVNDCSNVGFDVGETVTVRDLFYGTILPSGADAAVALAIYVAGSHEAFVDMMNEKAAELGLSETAHFTNCVGLYDKEHHCSVYDMAMIMEAAIDNEICREVLNAHIYTTSATEQHPKGIEISNWFLRKIEDKDTGGEVVCAKTGYVAQSGNCAVSYGVDRSGKGYICASTGAHSSWRCIYDHVAMYKTYAQQG